MIKEFLRKATSQEANFSRDHVRSIAVGCHAVIIGPLNGPASIVLHE